MEHVDLYGRVRHAVLVDGLSLREAARIFGINRRTVEKTLRFSIPSGYRRDKEIRRPKLDAYTGIIDQFLEADRLIPKKQRHTSKVMDLPHSDACFVKAYPAETTEAFCDAHVAAFAFFGGVSTSILYDNTRIVVARILGDGQRQRTRVFSELVSHYLFEDRFGP